MSQAASPSLEEFHLAELEERLEMTALASGAESPQALYCCECVGNPYCGSDAA
jgi:hypothetical protein